MDFYKKENVKWMSGWRNLPEAYLRIKTPGITSIIGEMIPDPDLDEWIKTVGEEKAAQISKSACDRGTAMHTFLEEFFKSYKEHKDISKALHHTQNESPKILEKEGIFQEKIKIGRDLFYNLYESNYAIPLLDTLGIELPIYSPYLFYRGKIDIVYRNLGISLSDFKTTNGPISIGSVKEKKYKLQLGGYALALEHMYKEKQNDLEINYTSIISMHTKSNMIFITECKDEELQRYKNDFAELCKEWHVKNNQSFIFGFETN